MTIDLPRAAARAAGRELGELVHQAAVERVLLGGVVVVLGAGDGLGAVETLRREEFGLLVSSVGSSPLTDGVPAWR